MCSKEGCTKKVSRVGLCWVHYEAYRMANAPLCRFSGCSIPSHAKGLCNKHYRIELNARPDRAFCSVDRCRDPVHANKLCTKHHVRLRRHGSLNPTRPKSFTGSDRHYEEFYRMAASRSLKRKYGITLLDYEEMHSKQKGKCLICGEKEKRINSYTDEPVRMPVDHCHVTGKVRGLLCSNCNTGIGNFNDSIEMLKKAISYLKEYN